MQSRILKAALFAAILSLAFTTMAQLPFAGVGKGSPALVKLRLTFDTVAGDQVQGTAIAEIEDRWHITSAKPLDDFSIPTVLTIDSPALKVTSVSYPPHVERTFEFASGKIAVYQGTIRIPFTATKTAASGSVTAKLRYQACNDSVCLPPTDVTATAEFTGAAGVPPPSTTAAPPTPAANFTPLATASQGAPERSIFDQDVAGSLAQRGLFLTLFFVFLGGLALNLTPCVYPLIPITLAFFSSQSEGSRMQRLGLSSSYVLGIAVMYSALGVFAALSGAIFGTWLQLPGVLIFFALLMVVLAASMFGMYEIRIPHFISDRAGARAGFAGALSMGLLVGIVAAPCVGPVIISLIAVVSQSRDVFLGFILFFALALGLGFPYLILGMSSSALSAMPRSGAWMDTVKRAMGFVLIAMAFYFLRPLIGDRWYVWGVVASLIVGALFLLGTGWKGPAKAVRIALAAVLLVAGVWFAMPQRAASHVSWAKYDEKLIATARETGKPVMIDFYADWCLPCKELDAKTFTDAKVGKEATRFVALKANLTSKEDPKARELSEKYGIVGVPTVVFIDAKGQEVPHLRLTGFEKPEKFVDRLRAMGM
jgi:Thiol:disulfide interchange protein